jgi:hypothetical protein
LPPSAKPKAVSRASRRRVRRAQGTAIPGRRSVKIRRSQRALRQNRRRTCSQMVTAYALQGRFGEHALVSAVDALGPPAAERAACCDPARLKGEGNRGVSGIEVPGLEPNVAPVRKKVREKIHSLYLATQSRSSKMAKIPL